MTYPGARCNPSLSFVTYGGLRPELKDAVLAEAVRATWYQARGVACRVDPATVTRPDTLTL